MSASQAAAYERALGLAMGTNPPIAFISPYTVEAYRQCAQKVRAIGAKPILLVTPSATQFNIAYGDNNARAAGGRYHDIQQPARLSQPVPQQRAA